MVVEGLNGQPLCYIEVAQLHLQLAIREKYIIYYQTVASKGRLTS